MAQRTQRVEMSLAEARARSQSRVARSCGETWGWSEAWPWAWRQVKTKAIEEEVKVRLSGQSWAEVWTRKEEKVWAQAMKGRRGGEQAWAQAWAWAQEEGRGRAEGMAVGPAVAANLARLSREKKAWARSWARAEMRGEAVAVAEALALAGVWAWAQSGGRARGEKLPSGLADAATIGRILSDHHHHRTWMAPRLWDRSPETRDEYSCIIHSIAPLTRLPFELLRHIFLIILDEANGPPLVLMLVCKYWHTIVTGIWGSLNLGTRTPKHVVTSKLGRNQLLDIVVNMHSDRGDFTPSDGAFDGIFAAMEASSRWRSLVVDSFPAQADLPEALVNRCLQQCSNATMSRFTTFKIKSACEPSSLLTRLLRILGTTAGSELTTVEINSSNVISSLVPAYPSMFHSVKVLTLNTLGMANPVNLLPHLHHLETFTASHMSFPIYQNDVDLPFIHTLRHLRLTAVPIQWMSGRTFYALEDCTLIFPLHRHVIHTFSTTLPNCKHLTFQGSPLDILKGISAHKLTHFSVTCSSPSNRRGNQQLLQLSHQVLAESRLAPTILHIGIEATSHAWINAFNFMSGLEELVIESVEPSSLGAKMFQSLIVQSAHARNRGAPSTSRERSGPLCPSLKRFGLRYRRWLRHSEHFNLIPHIVFVIRSRRSSGHPLQRFGIWMTSDQRSPLELIEESQMSRQGMERLAKESGKRLYWIPYGDPGPIVGSASQDEGPRRGEQVGGSFLKTPILTPCRFYVLQLSFQFRFRAPRGL